jgi:hypothetical protein
MAAETIPRFRELFEDHAGEHLRSIVRYECDDYEVVSLREDVAVQYNDRELYEAVDQNRLDSLAPPVYEETFADDHGDMTCLIECFENVVDMNFILDDGIGVIVTLDAEAMAESHGLIATAHEILVAEHER